MSSQLGIKVMVNSAVGDFLTTPEMVSMPPAAGRVVAISCGSNHNFALTASEEVYSWGYGEMLALGHGRDKDEVLPRRVAFESNELAGVKISHVACGGQHSAFIGRALGIR
jgi:regulator of chromosome condensation